MSGEKRKNEKCRGKEISAFNPLPQLFVACKE
jgi:hypothetical protein